MWMMLQHDEPEDFCDINKWNPQRPRICGEIVLKSSALILCKYYLYFQAVTVYYNSYFAYFINSYFINSFAFYDSHKLAVAICPMIRILNFHLFLRRWEGEGVNEVGKDKATGVVRVKVNPKFYRPTEVVSYMYQFSSLLELSIFGYKFNLAVNRMMYNPFVFRTRFSLILLNSKREICGKVV